MIQITLGFLVLAEGEDEHLRGLDLHVFVARGVDDAA